MTATAGGGALAALASRALCRDFRLVAPAGWVFAVGAGSEAEGARGGASPVGREAVQVVADPSEEIGRVPKIN